MTKGHVSLSVQALLGMGAVAMLSIASALTVIGAVSLASMAVGASEDTIAGSASEDFVGSWQGRLEPGDQSLRIILHVDVSEVGQLAASIDSPDQGVLQIPVARVETDKERLRLGIEVLHATFEAQLSADKTIIEGEWSQSGIELPLRLELISPNH